MEARGAPVGSLPPYSPALAPLEPGWSKVKTALRKAQARTREALERALTQGLSTVTAVEVQCPRTFYTDLDDLICKTR